MSEKYVCQAKIGSFEYTLTRKRVKNVNLRISRDGKVSVSAPFGVSEDFISDFVGRNAKKILDFIAGAEAETQKAEKRYSRAEENEFLVRAKRICAEIAPLFPEKYQKNIKIEICRGHTRFGYCVPSRRLVRLNILLSEYDDEVIRYVAMHEYCHFLIPNHSDAFYAELRARMPDFEKYRQILKN